MITGSVDLLSLEPKFFSVCQCFISNIPSGLAYGFSKLKSYINNRFFNNEIRIYGNKNFKEIVSKQDKFIALFMPFNFLTFGKASSEIFYQPFDYFKIGINNNHTQSEVVFLSIETIGFLSFYTEMAFTIKKTGTISKNLISKHIVSFIKEVYGHYYTINCIISNALNDLSGQTLKSEAKVLTASKVAEENPKWFSRQIQNIWSIKSKRMLYVAINQQVTLVLRGLEIFSDGLENLTA